MKREKFPSLGGVAGPKGLTGWSRTAGQRDGAKRRQFPFPSLGGVAGAKRLTGWSVTFPHTPQEDHPGGSAATPPKEGNFS